MGLRFYIVSDDGLKRVSLKVIDGREPLPQFANRRMKAIQAHYQGEDDDLRFDVLGHYIHFDKDGIAYVPDAVMHDAAELMWTGGEIDRERLETPKVTNFDLRHRVKSLKSENPWTLSEAETSAIAADLLGSTPPPGTTSIPLATPRKTSSPKTSTAQKLYLVYCQVFRPEEDEPSPQHRHFEFLLKAVSPDDAEAKCKARFTALPKEGALAFSKGTRLFVDHVIEITDVPDDGVMFHYVRYGGELSATGVVLPYGGDGLRRMRLACRTTRGVKSLSLCRLECRVPAVLFFPALSNALQNKAWGCGPGERRSIAPRPQRCGGSARGAGGSSRCPASLAGGIPAGSVRMEKIRCIRLM
jgi:hypothetical protein